MKESESQKLARTSHEDGYARGVADERARIIKALREDYEQTPATAAEFADEIESGRL